MATPPHITDHPDPRNAAIASGKRAIQLATAGVMPPSALYLQPEDSLQLYITYPLVGAAYTVNLLMRWLRPDGEIVTIRRQFVANASPSTFTFTLGEGFLLSATATTVSGGVAEPGGVFADFYIVRDTPELSMVMWTLFSDYISSGHFASWPYGKNIFSQEGPGRMRSIVGTTPGVGTEISETVPANLRWSLQAFRVRIVTSAVAANRKPSFIIDDGVNTLFQSDSNLVTVASSNGSATLCNVGYLNGIITNAACMAPLPPIMLGPGFRIRTTTSGIDVGDQYDSPKYLVQEWVSQ